MQVPYEAWLKPIPFKVCHSTPIPIQVLRQHENAVTRYGHKLGDSCFRSGVSGSQLRATRRQGTSRANAFTVETSANENATVRHARNRRGSRGGDNGTAACHSARGGNAADDSTGNGVSADGGDTGDGMHRVGSGAGGGDAGYSAVCADAVDPRRRWLELRHKVSAVRQIVQATVCVAYSSFFLPLTWRARHDEGQTVTRRFNLPPPCLARIAASCFGFQASQIACQAELRRSPT